jgi:hypothetical protein
MTTPRQSRTALALFVILFGSPQSVLLVEGFASQSSPRSNTNILVGLPRHYSWSMAARGVSPLSRRVGSRLPTSSRPSFHSILGLTQNNVYQADVPSSPRKKNIIMTPQRPLLLLLSTIGIMAGVAVLFSKRKAILATLDYLQNKWLLTTLDNLHAAGPRGLLLYTVGFVVWEMTVGMTTPVETAAGMAFGPARGIVASGIGKVVGASLTFLLSRYIFFDKVHEKLQDNAFLSLLEESIQETPLKIALLCRFSPLPEFIKNCGKSKQIQNERCHGDIVLYGTSYHISFFVIYNLQEWVSCPASDGGFWRPSCSMVYLLRHSGHLWEPRRHVFCGVDLLR